MNKRIILVDSNEFSNYSKLYGIGLDSNSIYTLQYLDSLPDDKRNEILSLGNSDAVMLIGGEAFKYLRKFYHFGIRNENYADCSKLRRLSIEGGSFAKCTVGFPEQKDINDFLSDSFTVHRDFSWFKQKVIHTFEESMRFLDYMDALPMDTSYGLDYEASGMPLDMWFEMSGVSICNVKYGGFISFTDVRHQLGGSLNESYKKLLNRLRDFLEKRQSHIWVYNMQYEFQVSHRMLNNVDLYNLCDASVFNVLDGNHLKKYSLKWSGNMILQSTVWDTEFDRISDLVDSMLFEEVGKLKRDKHKVLKVTKENFKETKEWKELCNRYPNYVEEFERLILEYWGNPFMCIPSDILGYYCNLDAFYTLMIYEERKKDYSEEAIQVFLDNTRLGCRLHSSGLYVDEDYRLRYQKECYKMMAWGITYCAASRCWIKMEKHKKKMTTLSKYNPICRKLLDMRIFHNGNSIEITKSLLVRYLDTMEAYDSELNEGALLMDFGEKFAEDFISIVNESKKEIKFKAKIDQNIVKKKKLLSTIAEKLIKLIGLDKLKLGEKHTELEKYIYYKQAFDEFSNIFKTQMTSINNIPDQITAFGTRFMLEDYSTYISENYFKCKSPIENDEIIDEMFNLYKTETSFLAGLTESVQQLPGNKKEEFFSSLGIDNIEDGYNHFMSEWEKYIKSNGTYHSIYPDKIFNISLESWRKGIDFEPSKDVHPVKDVWADFSGFTIQSTFFNKYNNQYLEYGSPFSVDDFKDKFFFMRKFTLNYLLNRKYSKVLSTYIDGMFHATGKWVIEGKDHIPIREANPMEPGSVFKIFTKYEVNTKSSKRLN